MSGSSFAQQLVGQLAAGNDAADQHYFEAGAELIQDCLEAYRSGAYRSPARRARLDERRQQITCGERWEADGYGFSHSVFAIAWTMARQMCRRAQRCGRHLLAAELAGIIDGRQDYTALYAVTKLIEAEFPELVL